MTTKLSAMSVFARNGWRLSNAVRLVLVISVCFIATWPAWGTIFVEASFLDLARPGVLVLPVMVWLIWVRRARFRFIRPGGYEIGWLVLLAGMQFYYMGHFLYGLDVAWQLGAVLMLAGSLFVCTGRSVVVQFLPAWLIMPLLVPIPETVSILIAAPIQKLEVNAIAALYGLFGVEVELLVTPISSWVLVGGTKLPLDSVFKGLSTALSLMLISYGFVFGAPIRMSVRLLLLLASPLLALFCSAVALGGTLWVYDGALAVPIELIGSLVEWITLLLAFVLIASMLRVLAWASVPVYQYHLASTAS